MACRYEEEIFRDLGKVDKCGCSTCPYKNLEECKEVNTMGIMKKLWEEEQIRKEEEMKLGVQEPPQDYRIFNRRQPDGSFRSLAEFFEPRGIG